MFSQVKVRDSALQTLKQGNVRDIREDKTDK